MVRSGSRHAPGRSYSGRKRLSPLAWGGDQFRIAGRRRSTRLASPVVKLAGAWAKFKSAGRRGLDSRRGESRPRPMWKIVHEFTCITPDQSRLDKVNQSPLGRLILNMPSVKYEGEDWCTSGYRQIGDVVDNSVLEGIVRVFGPGFCEEFSRLVVCDRSPLHNN